MTRPLASPLRRSVLGCLLLAAVAAGCGDSPEPDPQARAAAEWALKRGGRIRIVDQGGVIAGLANLPAGEFALEAIDLNSLDPANPVRDLELEVLRGLTNLRVLGLYGSDVSDKGVDAIATLTTLREIELSQTRVTDAGLARLAELPHLERLFLRNLGKQITDDGVKSFHARRPGVEVFR